ncbi:MAG TPA: tyrosine-type recombinase/integrase [Candidatus Dormibacteraeota bacterium]|nr:tyrosine-type recombinase/integrase [Candidatus Dormibacteraeota bacterium]
MGKAADDLVFTSSNGSVPRASNFRRDVWDHAVKAVGLDGLVPHGLRHTAASLAIAAGADVKVVQQMLGHYAGDRCQVDHEWCRYRRVAVA